MAYPADFADAHRRHWEDAELLFAHERWANADHLYGFSVECGLKAVMRALGMPVEPDGRPERSAHRKHVQDLWSVFRTFVASRSGEWFLHQLPAGEPFRDWSHHDRYASRAHYSRLAVVPHQGAARTVLLMIQRATLDGRL